MTERKINPVICTACGGSFEVFGAHDKKPFICLGCKEAGEAMRILNQARIFPLQTIQSMADRWGVPAQRVNHWRERDANFPKRIEGITVQTARMPSFYPLYEVETYERRKGLRKDV